MSFYTALTGLNGSQADIAELQTTSLTLLQLVMSRAEFGDICYFSFAKFLHQLVLVLS